MVPMSQVLELMLHSNSNSKKVRETRRKELREARWGERNRKREKERQTVYK